MWRTLKVRWWSWKFRRQCSSVGNQLTILGPCELSANGTLQIGDGVTIRSRQHNQVEISVAPEAKLEIGNHVFLNQGVRIACSREIKIGDHTQIGDETVILDNDYHAVGQAGIKVAPVHIESHVWLGTRVVVLRGVTIGRGSVVGAGAVVTRSIPPFVFAAGVPAQVVKSLPQSA